MKERVLWEAHFYLLECSVYLCNSCLTNSCLPQTRRKKKPDDSNEITTPKEYTDFVKSRTVDLSQWIKPGENGTSAPAVVYTKVGMDMHCFAFTDGSVKVIRCELLSEEEHKRQAVLLCDFVAHPDSEILSVSPFPWTSVRAVYLLEILTSGKDHRIRHFGIRANPNPSLDLLSHSADELGVLVMPLEPRSKLGDHQHIHLIS